MPLLVNGRRHDPAVPDHASLLDALREALQLTGTKRGCDRGECGACTVQLDGAPAYACLALAAACDGREVRTIEGIADDPAAAPLLAAFAARDAVQCGYCTPAQVVTADAVLRDVRDGRLAPSRDALAAAMSGVLCRCGTTAHLLDALATLAADVAPAAADA